MPDEEAVANVLDRSFLLLLLPTTNNLKVEGGGVGQSRDAPPWLAMAYVTKAFSKGTAGVWERSLSLPSVQDKPLPRLLSNRLLKEIRAMRTRAEMEQKERKDGPEDKTEGRGRENKSR